MALPFGTWPSLPYAVAPLPSVADEIQHFYVRTPVNGGSDTQGNGSIPQPFATPQRAASELQRFNGRPTVVHMGSGVYQRPVLNGLRGPVVFVGDGGGASLDDGLNQELAPTAADVGTGAGTVTGTFAPGAFDGFAIEMIDGAAAGQRRTIQETTPTDLIPAALFSPAPAAGDLYRVVSPNIFWQGWQSSAPWMQGCGAPLGIGFSSPPADLNTVWRAVYLVNLLLTDAAPFSSRVADSAVALYGVQGAANMSSWNAQDCFTALGADQASNQSAANLGLLLGIDPLAYRGYTLSSQSLSPLSLAVFSGTASGTYVSTGGISVGQFGGLLFYGGRLACTGGTSGVTLAQSGTAEIFLAQSPQLLILTEAGFGARCRQGATLRMNSGEIVSDSGDCIRVDQGSIATLAAATLLTAVAGNAVNASQAGRVSIDGDPTGNWTGGSADTRVSATEDLAAAGYVAVDTTLVAAVGNGSIITRTS